MKTVAINLDGVVRDFHSKFDFIYRKVFIHNQQEVKGNIPTHQDVAAGNLDEKSFTYELEQTEEALEKLAREIEEKEKKLINLPVESAELTNHYKFVPQVISMTALNSDKIHPDSSEEIRLSSKQVLEKFVYEDYPFQIFGRAEQYVDAMETVNKIQSLGKRTGQFNTILVSNVKGAAIPATFAFLSTHGCRVKNILFLDSSEEKWEHCDLLIDADPAALHSKPADKKVIKINRTWNKWDKIQPSFEELKAVYSSKVLETIFVEKNS